MNIRSLAVSAASIAIVAGVPAPAWAQERTYSFDIPARDLGAGIREFAKESRQQVSFDGALVAGKRSNGVKGNYAPEEALTRLLRGSGLGFRKADRGVFVLTAGELGNGASAQRAGMPRNSVEQSGAAATVASQQAIVVTGSHIRGAAPAGTELVTLDRKTIDQSGRSTTADLVRSLPQNVGLGASEEALSPNAGGRVANIGFATPANLRGLGPDETLVLLNGHRMAPTAAGHYVDISQIPLAAVDRVEIVLDGSSAIYGSDAVGGVINFILKRDFNGAETNGRYDEADGFHRYSVDQTFGHSWGSGHVIISYEHFKQSHLSANDRSFYTQNLTPFGGPDLRLQFSNPGTISAGGTTYAIPHGQNGVGLSPSQLVPRTKNLLDKWTDADILPAQRRDSIIASLSQDLTPTLTIYFDGIYSNRSFNDREPAQTATLTIPSSNPFFVSPISGAKSVNVLYSFLDDYGPERFHGHVKDYNATLGGDLHLGPWIANAFVSQSADLLHSRTDNLSNSALRAPTLAASNPATAFDAFGDGSFTNPATLAAIQGYGSDFTQRYWDRSADVSVSGPLARLPGGLVRFAGGADYREETVKFIQSAFSSTPQPVVGSASFPGTLRRHVSAAYAELKIPVVGDDNAVPFARKLEFSIAARTEHYSDFGSTTNPKVGITWSPAAGIDFRGTWGTSFKAPELQDLDGSATNISTIRVPDPNAPGGISPVIFFSGANPMLKPEKAKTWNIGVDFKPRPIPGLRLSASYFNIHYDNKVSGLTASVLADLLRHPDLYGPLIIQLHPTAAQVQALYSDPRFVASATQFPANQIAAIADFRNINTLRVDEDGVDLNGAYDFDTAFGHFEASSATSLVLTYKTARSASAEATSSLGIIGNPIKTRSRDGLAWDFHGLSASVFVNYVGSYRNTLVTPAAKVSAWTTTDLQLAYQPPVERGVLSGLRLALDIRNAFNRKPPAVANITAQVGYDPENADALGRVVSLSVRKRW